jgi:hypothetical protein
LGVKTKEKAPFCKRALPVFTRPRSPDSSQQQARYHASAIRAGGSLNYYFFLVVFLAGFFLAGIELFSFDLDFTVFLPGFFFMGIRHLLHGVAAVR